jgi:hypothetical protein
MKLPARGSCQCGNVNYEITVEPLATYACHCRDCQKLSTSAFSVTMLLGRSGLEVLSGELTSWERPTASGGVAVCWFCPDCGNRIFSREPRDARFYSTKARDPRRYKRSATSSTCLDMSGTARVAPFHRFAEIRKATRHGSGHGRNCKGRVTLLIVLSGWYWRLAAGQNHLFPAS